MFLSSFSRILESKDEEAPPMRMLIIEDDYRLSQALKKSLVEEG